MFTAFRRRKSSGIRGATEWQIEYGGIGVTGNPYWSIKQVEYDYAPAPGHFIYA